MENWNYEVELKRVYKLVKSLAEEIDYKNHKLSQMQIEYEETTAGIRKIVTGLTEKLNARDQSLLELEKKYQDSSATVRWLMDEKVMLRKEYNKDIRNLKSTNVDLKYNMECQRKEIKQLTKKLEESKAQNDLEQRQLVDEIKQLKENLGTQNLVDTKKNLIGELRNELKEKEDALLDMESLNRTLMSKELMSNQELQDARKESISGLEVMLTSRSTLGIKRMGDLDYKAFRETCLHKFSNEDWEDISAKLCSTWEENLMDPHWYPYKKENVKGLLQELIDDDDEKLKGLRNEYGEVVYKAVTNALLELNEYNPSGRYPVPEIWNLKEKRRASMKEIINYVIKQLKSQKRKRRR